MDPEFLASDSEEEDEEGEGADPGAPPHVQLDKKSKQLADGSSEAERSAKEVAAEPSAKEVAAERSAKGGAAERSAKEGAAEPTAKEGEGPVPCTCGDHEEQHVGHKHERDEAGAATCSGQHASVICLSQVGRRAMACM